MAFETSIVRTRRYGLVGVSVNPVDEDGEPGVGTTEQLSGYDFSDSADKTWGLSTKFYVLSALENHNADPDAHLDEFNGILSRYSDVVKDGHDMKFNKIADNEGNIVYANCMVSHDGGKTKGFIVTSADRTAFDRDRAELDEKLSEAKKILDGKQDLILKAGENVEIDPETNTISAKDTIYDLPPATDKDIGGVYLDNTLKQGGRNPVAGGVVKMAIDSVVNSVKPIPETPVSEGDTTKVTLADGNDMVVTPGRYTAKLAVTLKYGDSAPMDATLLVLHDDIQEGKSVVMTVSGGGTLLFGNGVEEQLVLVYTGTRTATRFRFVCDGDGRTLVDRTDYRT